MLKPGSLAALSLGLLLSLPSFAAPQLRIGTLAPKNSLYHRQLMEVGEAWRASQGEGAKYLIYPDGSQGGETDMARRMREAERRRTCDTISASPASNIA